MDFKTELKIYQDIVNKELEKYLRKDECIEKVLNNAMEYSLMAGGKRLRPILVLATYKLFKENIEECLPYAVAIEMVHNFSLIHDDLPGIDNDDFRHGKPTNHKQFNEATAILAGDGLLNNAYMVIANDLQHTNNEINMDNINSNHNINSKNCIKNLKNLENKNNPISYVEKLNKKIRIFNEFSNCLGKKPFILEANSSLLLIASLNPPSFLLTKYTLALYSFIIFILSSLTQSGINI